MTREEMLKFCSVCKNRKMDLKRGLVCCITDDYADFDPVCENYSQDIEEKRWKSVKQKIDKKERQKDIIGRIIPIVLYFVFLCCLLIPTLSIPIYIIAILNVLVVAAIVVANILYWRKLIKKRNVDSELTLDKIMECIRKEGYYPQKQDDENIIFKIQGEPFEVYYDADIRFFQILRRYQISDDLISVAEKAAFATMASRQLIKIVTYHGDGFNNLVFSVEAKLLSSSNIEACFSHYMYILLESIDNHRELFNKILEEQVENEAPRPKIGFPSNSSSIKS